MTSLGGQKRQRVENVPHAVEGDPSKNWVSWNYMKFVVTVNKRNSSQTKEIVNFFQTPEVCIDQRIYRRTEQSLLTNFPEVRRNKNGQKSFIS